MCRGTAFGCSSKLMRPLASIGLRRTMVDRNTSRCSFAVSFSNCYDGRLCFQKTSQETALLSMIHPFGAASLVQLCLRVNIWARRVYPDGLRIEGTIEETRRRVLAEIRQSYVETVPGPPPFLALARGISLFADRLRDSLPETEAVFQQHTGLAIDDYFAVVGYLAVLGIDKSVAGLRDPELSGLLRVDLLTNASDPSGDCLNFSSQITRCTTTRLAFWVTNGMPRTPSGLPAQVVDTPMTCMPVMIESLADKLGFYDAFVGEHLTDACETITNSLLFHATLRRSSAIGIQRHLDGELFGKRKVS